MKNLNVVGAIQNCFKGMIINEVLDGDAFPFGNHIIGQQNFVDSSLSTVVCRQFFVERRVRRRDNLPTKFCRNYFVDRDFFENIWICPSKASSLFPFAVVPNSKRT